MLRHIAQRLIEALLVNNRFFAFTGWPKKMCTHENFNRDFD